MITIFWFPLKKKASTWQILCTWYFWITIYLSTKCTWKSKFQNDVWQFPQCKSHIEIIVVLSVLSVLLEHHCLTRIVGLIQIHPASLESIWLSMLHNRVSILKWHLFIPSIPWDYVSNLYQHHLLSMLITRGTQPFFVGRDVRGGSPKWPGSLVFRGRYHPRKTSCNSTVGANRLAGPIISWTDHYISVNSTVLLVFGQKMRTSGVLHLPQAQCKRTQLLGLIHASLQPWQ